MEFVIIVSGFDKVFYAHFEHAPEYVFRSKNSAVAVVAQAFNYFADDLPLDASFTVHIVMLQKRVDDMMHALVGEVRASQ